MYTPPVSHLSSTQIQLPRFPITTPSSFVSHLPSSHSVILLSFLKNTLGSHFLVCHDMPPPPHTHAFWVILFASFSGKPDSYPWGWWVKMSLFSDIWVITMKYAEPMNTHTRGAALNLISFHFASKCWEFPLMSAVRRAKVQPQHS